MCFGLAGPLYPFFVREVAQEIRLLAHAECFNPLSETRLVGNSPSFNAEMCGLVHQTRGDDTWRCGL